MLLNDKMIRNLCRPNPHEEGKYSTYLEYQSPPDGERVTIWGTGMDLPMIEPFVESTSEGVISYGLDHAGYCLRLAPNVLVLKNTFGEALDPKRFKEEGYRQKVFDEVWPDDGGRIIIPPHGYVLGCSHEYLRIPSQLKGRCVGKSTMARCGIIVNTTPLEPGWEGKLTIEISNSSPLPAVIYAMEGICQVEFEMLCDTPEVDYAMKKGKYQGQTETTPARVS